MENNLHLAPPGTTPTAVTATAVLDDAHTGHINGALGTIAYGDTAARPRLSLKLKTLLAIVGPGLIVMAGDNDAGAFSTYGQAGQNFGTHLMWTLGLLVPVLYVCQDMVLRLGAVTGVGHARLILERYGRFWGAFSVIDLFLLNALTIVTEFIGISLAVSYLGLPKVPAVLVAAVAVVAADPRPAPAGRGLVPADLRQRVHRYGVGGERVHQDVSHRLQPGRGEDVEVGAHRVLDGLGEDRIEVGGQRRRELLGVLHGAPRSAREMSGFNAGAQRRRGAERQE